MNAERDFDKVYLIFATPADSWTESMAMARTWDDAQERIYWFEEHGYEGVRVIHPNGKKEKVGWV